MLSFGLESELFFDYAILLVTYGALYVLNTQDMLVQESCIEAWEAEPQNNAHELLDILTDCYYN